MKFLDKMKGVSQSPPPVSSIEICLSWLGAFLGVGLVGLVNNLIVGADDNVLMITSFGASAVPALRSPQESSGSTEKPCGRTSPGGVHRRGHLQGVLFSIVVCLSPDCSDSNRSYAPDPDAPSTCRGYRVVCSNRRPQHSPDGIFLPDLSRCDRCRNTLGRCPGFQQSFEESTISAVLDIGEAQQL